MLNCVLDTIILAAAKRNIQQMDIVPLFYNAYKADKEILSNEIMFNALKRAHEYSGIGQVSNNLTKLWNRDDPDIFAAACLCRYNNAVIDAAKCAKIDSYENYPKVNERIVKATGGRRGKMPHFFQFSKNGRRDNGINASDCAKPNRSTMNRICEAFSGIGRLNLRMAGVPPFDWRMLLDENDSGSDQEIVEIFVLAVQKNICGSIASGQTLDLKEKSRLLRSEMMNESIVHDIEQVMPLEQAYKSIVKHLFSEDSPKISLKQVFWDIFGEIAYEKIKANLASCQTCSNCGGKYPSWVGIHACPHKARDFLECADCGKLVERTSPRQCRCLECQAAYRKLRVKQNVQRYRKKKAS